MTRQKQRTINRNAGRNMADRRTRWSIFIKQIKIRASCFRRMFATARYSPMLATQLVKLHRRGISENKQKCWLLFSKSIMFALGRAIYVSPHVCGSAHMSERVCVCALLLPDEVTMRDGAAGRACHCQSLFCLLFCFLPEEEKVLHGNQQPPGVMRCHGLSVCLLAYIYISLCEKSIFKCVHVFGNIHVDVAVSQQAKKEKVMTRVALSLMYGKQWLLRNIFAKHIQSATHLLNNRLPYEIYGAIFVLIFQH